MRRLGHAVVAHEVDDDTFARIGLTVLRGAGLRVGELLDLEIGSVIGYGPAGTWLRVPLGKLATDDSLFLQYRQVGENLSSATAKLNSNETTAGKFFSDPKFYDNMSGLAGDMRLLVGDFRKDPKKFLHVKFAIF